MKYVALLSGGKDSCFNLVHCGQNGHELVAAASLSPGKGKEELDSYMYQTVGQDAIELVAKALGVPLHRRCISGSAIEQGSEYGTRMGGKSSGVEGDETEDLYELLSEVKTQHPDVQGVSVGAILSNYQRVRVEHVCLRLSLTPLCYLWQRNQEELLAEMIESGVEAILIKVAGIGLKPKHLGQTLESMQPTLKHLNNLYGAHICGEGGEYETLTLDCPMYKQRIVLKDVETVIHSDNDFATVAYLRVNDASLEAKDPIMSVSAAIPPLLFEEYQNLETVLTNLPAVENSESHVTATSFGESIASSSYKSGKWVIVSNIQKSESTILDSVIEEVSLCFKLLHDQLAQYDLTIADLTFVNIFISDMSTFPEVNQAYKTFFGTSPPARACVSVDLPPGVGVKLDCLAYADESSERRALHVQGLSYWAPANIGPYSQAVITGDRIFISGQIGMQPSSLAMPSPPSFALEAALAFQHIYRVMGVLKETYGSNWNSFFQCLICWLANAPDIPKAQRIGDVLDSYTSVPTLFVGAKTLPKGGLVEAQVISHTGQYVATEDDGETEIRQCKSAIFDKGDIIKDDYSVHWEVSSFTEVSASCGVLAVKGNASMAMEQASTKFGEITPLKRTFSIRLFHRTPLHESTLEVIANLFSERDIQPGITTIPVRFIATREVDDWDFALCLIG